MLLLQNIKLIANDFSDKKDSKNYSTLDLHKIYLKFGWDGFGCHKIINKSGKVENGLTEYKIGAHVKSKIILALVYV